MLSIIILGTLLILQIPHQLVASDFALIENTKPFPPLRVYRNKFNYLSKSHLPIPPRVQDGQVCTIEVEQNSPFYCTVGCLKPKKFPCNFNNGDVVYYHNGNPLVHSDKVRVTIYYSRDVYSILQSVDLNVEIVDDTSDSDDDTDYYFNRLKPSYNYTANAVNVTNDNNLDINLNANNYEKFQHIISNYQPFKTRLRQLKNLQVSTIRGVSEAISPNILSIKFDQNQEECLMFFHHDQRHTWTESANDNNNKQENNPYENQRHFRVNSIEASQWPIFGNLISFNKSVIPSFVMDCKEALLKGYRYIHRKIDSPNVDYLPLEVNIYRRNSDGSRHMVTKQGIFLKVEIASQNSLRKPIIKTTREITLHNLGGTFSILPRDCIMVPKNSIPSEEYLDINITRIDSVLNRQFVNLKDPTREIFGFRLSDLREGLIAFQVLDYSEEIIKKFKIYIQPIDPFFQRGETVVLTLNAILRSPVKNLSTGEEKEKNLVTFQIFTLPLFTHTGAKTKIFAHNVQTIGYLDDKHVVFYVFKNVSKWNVSYPYVQKPKNPVGSISVNGIKLEEQYFIMQQVEAGQVVYETASGFCETIDRVKLTILLKSSGFIDLSRRRRASQTQRRGRSIYEPPMEVLPTSIHSPLFELPVRLFRLYDHVESSVLKSDHRSHVPHRSYKCFSSEDITLPEALIALRKDQVDIKFSVTNPPTQGILIRSSALPSYGQNSQELDKKYQSAIESGNIYVQPYFDQSVVRNFTLEDLEDSEICYLNQRNDRKMDVFGIQQLGNPDFRVFYFEIMVEKSTYKPLEASMNPSIMLQTQETVNFIPITSMHLNYKIKDSNEFYDPKNIIYKITKMPFFGNESANKERTLMTGRAIQDTDAGRIISLNEVQSSDHVGDTHLQSSIVKSLREEQPPVTTQFTQAQILSGDIVYVPPNSDIGFNVKTAFFEYSVAVPKNLGMYEKKMELRILPEDNLAPKIIKKYPSLNVTRDGEIAIDENYFECIDLDTPTKDLNVIFHKIPEFGKLLYYPLKMDRIQEQISLDKTQMSEKEISINSSLPIFSMLKSKIVYRQSGINVKKDSFRMSITDGKQKSDPEDVLINIHKRIIEIPEWLKFVNDSILVNENATIILHESIFPSINDPGNEAITDNSMRYIIMVKPTKGKILLNNDREISQFTTANLRDEKISYRHGPEEIGWKQVNDFAKIYDRKTTEVFNIDFVINPINSGYPYLKNAAVLQVKEGGSAILTNYHVTVHDSDTPEDEIVIQLVSPPKWGRLIIDNQDIDYNDFSEADNIRKIKFSLDQLRSGRVHYVNGEISKKVEVTDDVFSLKASDGNHTSNILKVEVVIQSTNDETPYVRMLKVFAVSIDKRKVLTPHLFATSDGDIPRDSLEITFPRLPKFGNLYQHWRHGEINLITPSTGPMPQSYLDMLNIVYHQEREKLPEISDRNIIENDHFTVQVSDGTHIIEKNATVLIRKENLESPTIKVKGEGLILDGIYWKSIADVLEVIDPDTLPEDLEIIIDTEPSLGKLKRMPRMNFDEEIIEDAIEAAWDIEESVAEAYGHTKLAMSNAGSLGGSKNEKIFMVNDRFTLRQLLYNRVHYVYNSNYTDDFVEDSCRFHVTDGEFISNHVELKIKIRKTNGFLQMQSVQDSQEYLNFAEQNKYAIHDSTMLNDEQSMLKMQDCFKSTEIKLYNKSDSVFSLEDLINKNCKMIDHLQVSIIRNDHLAEDKLLILDKQCFQLMHNSNSPNDLLIKSTIKFTNCTTNENFNIYLHVYMKTMTPEIIKLSVISNDKKSLVKIKGNKTKQIKSIESLPGVDVNLEFDYFNFDIDALRNRSEIFLQLTSDKSKLYERTLNDDRGTITKYLLTSKELISLETIYNGHLWYSPTGQSENMTEVLLEFKVIQGDLHYENVQLRIYLSSLPSFNANDDNWDLPLIRTPPKMDHLKRFNNAFGYYLTPNHLYHYNNQSIYKVVDVNGEALRVVNFLNGTVLNEFRQYEINQNIIGVLINDRTEGGSYDINLEFSLPEMKSKRVFKFPISWITFSMPRKRYIVCNKSGLIATKLERIGNADDLRKISSNVTLTIADEASSSVRVIPNIIPVLFEKGKLENVNVNISIDVSGKNSQMKKFKIKIGSPDGKVLISQTLAEIYVITRNTCKDRDYFIDLSKTESMNTMQSDESYQTQIMSMNKPAEGISLQEWMKKRNYTDLKTLISDLLNKNSKSTKGFCDTDWIKYKDRCYRYYSLKPTNWLEAREHCLKERSYLISIGSKEDQAWMVETFKDKFADSRFLWIGLTRETPLSEWMWDNGEYLNEYQNWAHNSKLQSGRAIPHKCSMLTWNQKLEWIRIKCNLRIKSFICMKNLNE